jgi:hypothetical protein
MPKRSSTRKPKEDFNQMAFRLVRELTSEDRPKAKEALSSALDSPDVRKEIMREMGSRGGKKGGKARAASLSDAKRSEIAKKAAAARWKNID